MLGLTITIKSIHGNGRKCFEKPDALLAPRKMGYNSPAIRVVVYIGLEMSGICDTAILKLHPMIREKSGMHYAHTCDLAAIMKCAGYANNVSNMVSIAAC